MASPGPNEVDDSMEMVEETLTDTLESLDRYIVMGDDYKQRILELLKIISRKRNCATHLTFFKNENGSGLIHNIAKHQQSTDVLKEFLKLCPQPLWENKTSEGMGQTPLHIVIIKGNIEAARIMLHHQGLLHVEATGSFFSDTVMMGGSALSVAALTFNTDIVDLLLEFGANIYAQNSRGDTVFHSLIRFAQIRPEKVESIIDMIEHINSKLHRDEIAKAWFYPQDSNGLTALKLAANFGEVDIFSSILKLKNVYRILTDNKGLLFDTYIVDITEIDTLTQAEWERSQSEDSQNDSPYPALVHQFPSVLDIICQLPINKASKMLKVKTIQEIINRKLHGYVSCIRMAMAFHYLITMFIAAYAMGKTQIINDHMYPSSNYSQNWFFETPELKNIIAMYVLIVYLSCVAVLLLVLEGIRTFHFKQPWHLHAIHHNGLYRLMTVAMSVAIIVDIIWFLIIPYNNYFAITAMILCFAYTDFFFRTVDSFAFFIVMLKKVLFGDMFRFCVIILHQFLPFATSMYILFNNAKPVPNEFKDWGSTFMTMFKLMTGLADIDILFDARQAWIPVIIFVFFVIITNILMINSLIALMAQTCASVSEDRHMMGLLMRLSVIIHLETVILPKMRYPRRWLLVKNRYFTIVKDAITN